MFLTTRGTRWKIVFFLSVVDTQLRWGKAQGGGGEGGKVFCTEQNLLTRNSCKRTSLALRGVWATVYKTCSLVFYTAVFTMALSFPYLYLLKRVYPRSHCNLSRPIRCTLLSVRCGEVTNFVCSQRLQTCINKMAVKINDLCTYTAAPRVAIREALPGCYEES